MIWRINLGDQFVKNRYFLAVLLTFASSLPIISAAEDCQAIPADAMVSVEALIARSTRISLVSVAVGKSSGVAEPKANGEVRLDLGAERRKATESEALGDDRVDTLLRIAQLEVIEDLKGGGPATVYRPSLPVTQAQHDFNAHSDDAFWNDSETGLVVFDEDCQAVMQFEQGKRYLIFEGPAHIKGAELIESDEDAWLAYVRKAVE